MTRQEELNRARSVLITAKEHHIWEPQIPEDEDALIEQAQYVIDQADEAWEKNIRGPAVQAVRFAAEVTGIAEGADIKVPFKDEKEVDDPPTEEDLPGDLIGYTAEDAKEFIELAVHDEDQDILITWLDAEQQTKNRKTVVKAIDDALDRLDTVNQSADEEALERALEDDPGVDENPKKSPYDEAFEAEAFAKAKAKKNNLPTPTQIEDSAVPELTRETVVNASIDELQERLVDSSLCLSAATWKTAIAQIDEEHCERVANHYFQKAFRKSVVDAKNKDQAVAIAEEDPKVIEWRNKTEHAHNSYTTHRALKEIYKGYYDTVSRVFAMKVEERERRAYS